MKVKENEKTVALSVYEMGIIFYGTRDTYSDKYGKGFDLGVEPPRIKLWWVSFPHRGSLKCSYVKMWLIHLARIFVTVVCCVLERNCPILTESCCFGGSTITEAPKIGSGRDSATEKLSSEDCSISSNTKLSSAVLLVFFAQSGFSVAEVRKETVK